MVGTDSEMPSDAVRDLLRAFDGLTEDDQWDFLSEILRRTKDLQWSPLDEEATSRIADESFLEYNTREAADA
jgi:hypothetical protein